ncbi:hypothetical protein FRC08_003666 [Ceratobasidium sp. 394]|nr:hypothetical protein FRC08_003666 [Ceratobasidium sp. 394]
MSHTKHTGVGADKNMTLYAPLLTEIHTALSSLATNHNQITAHQPTRAQQSVQNATTWGTQQKRLLGQYFANPNRLSHQGLLETVEMDASLDDLNHQLQQADEQLLKREMNMAQRQIADCGRLMGIVSNMMEKLRADDEQYRKEREARRREEEKPAWRVRAEEKNRFIRAWANSSAAVEMGKKKA